MPRSNRRRPRRPRRGERRPRADRGRREGARLTRGPRGAPRGGAARVRGGNELVQRDRGGKGKRHYGTKREAGDRSWLRAACVRACVQRASSVLAPVNAASSSRALHRAAARPRCLAVRVRKRARGRKGPRMAPGAPRRARAAPLTARRSRRRAGRAPPARASAGRASARRRPASLRGGAVGGGGGLSLAGQAGPCRVCLGYCTQLWHSGRGSAPTWPAARSRAGRARAPCIANTPHTRQHARTHTRTHAHTHTHARARARTHKHARPRAHTTHTLTWEAGDEDLRQRDGRQQHLYRLPHHQPQLRLGLQPVLQRVGQLRHLVAARLLCARRGRRARWRA
jgi:hypothetical protein